MSEITNHAIVGLETINYWQTGANAGFIDSKGPISNNPPEK